MNEFPSSNSDACKGTPSGPIVKLLKIKAEEMLAGLVAQIFYHPSNRGQTPEIGGGDFAFRHYQPVPVL